MAFRDIIGQDRAIKELRRVGSDEKIPHAFLFTGLPGTGKKTAALNFSKLLNCLSPREDDCCDECSNCIRITSRNHPDVILIEEEGQAIGIDTVRSLEEELYFAPLEGKKRVIVIDDSQKMTDEAANALLKTLEEPPQDNILILIAPEPNMLLPTVVSRTCHLRFQPLTESSIERILTEREFLDRKRAGIVARAACGSLERAQELFKHHFMERRKRILEDLREIGSGDFSHLFKIAERWASSSEFLHEDLDLLKMWWRDLIVFKLSGKHEVINDENVLTLPDFVNADFSVLMRTYRLITEIQIDLARRINKRFATEKLVMGLRECIHDKDSGSSLSRRRENI